MNAELPIVISLGDERAEKAEARDLHPRERRRFRRALRFSGEGAQERDALSRQLRHTLFFRWSFRAGRRARLAVRLDVLRRLLGMLDLKAKHMRDEDVLQMLLEFCVAVEGLV